MSMGWLQGKSSPETMVFTQLWGFWLGPSLGIGNGPRSACLYLFIYIYIYGPVLRLSTPPHGLGPQVAAPIPFYLQAIGSISEVQLRIC